MATDLPLVTIGIPFHNAAGTILDAVRSIFAQTYPHWELILAADGSTDGSDQIARSICDPRVRVIGDDQRRFISRRLNDISQAARGQFIARMDGDDLSAPERIKRQIEFLLDHPEIDGCGAGMYSMDGKCQVIGCHIPPATHGEICADPVRGIRLIHATFVARTDWFRRHPYDERMIHGTEDWDLWLRTFQVSRFANLREPLYLYRSVGMIDLRRYCIAKRAVARTVLNSNPGIGGWPRRAAFAVKQYVEMGVYAGVSLVSAEVAQRRLSRRRGTTLTPIQVEHFAELIESIGRSHVPLDAANPYRTPPAAEC